MRTYRTGATRVNRDRVLPFEGAALCLKAMRLPLLPVLTVLVLTSACTAGEPAPSEASAGPPEESAVVLQAVDAGTGGALSNDRLTVRYLVRSPITLDASAVEEISATEPYRIEHEVGEDSLVVEVRLEAPAYHRVDTVLAVARGGSSGPFTIRMTRRLGRQAGGETRPSRTSDEARPTPSRPEPSPSGAEAPGGGTDRPAMRAGDRAFDRGDWSSARAAYQRMESPDGTSGAYAREYQAALVRKGISHINLGEWGSAMETLEEAVTFDSVNPTAYLRLGQAQCAVGMIEVGHQTLAELRRLPSVPSHALALARYQDALCAQREFESAEGTMARLQTGSQAIQELEAFIEEAEALSPVPAEVDSALTDARARIEEIRGELRGAGRGGG